jgi:ComF family protein
MRFARALPARFLGRFLREVLDAVYPELCPLCRAPSLADGPTGGCAVHAFDPAGELGGRRCVRCAAEISAALPRGEPCARCRLAPPSYERVLALADYRADAALREWILRLKHGGRPELAHALGGWLGELLARALGTRRARGVGLVPVPLHPLRRLERGYDQAELLARGAALGSGATLFRCLRRRRWTPAQGALEAPSRASNVQGAFEVVSGRYELGGRALWLVDDVLTSGATAEACAAALLAEGAASVSVLCLARAGEGANPLG